jgi:NAD(P)-dependent dehydrogenase (short-subunit alcohol dehydrogenase family)
VLDVRDGDAVRAHIDEVHATLGPVDTLVNNAGGTFYAMTTDVSDKGQLSLVHENFTSATNFVRAVVPIMPPEGGSIINVTSIEAFQAAPGFGVYAAMKAALTSLTKTLALELAERGIRVNCVAPDGIPTPGDEPLSNVSAGSALFTATHRPPLGYFADADACAAPIVFLASDMGKFLTGITINVDGGNWAAGGWRRNFAE